MPLPKLASSPVKKPKAEILPEPPAAPDTEVQFYQVAEMGRFKLSAYCHEHEKIWGIVSPVTTLSGGKTTVQILVGTMYTVETHGTVDAALLELAEELEANG
jgi:hypothetical protein